MNNKKPTSYTEAIAIGVQNGLEFNASVKARKELISDRIKLLRTTRKISQEALSEKIDVNRITYSGYENGRAEPSAEVLVRIATFFDVSLDYVCCRTDNPKGIYSAEKSKNDELDIVKEEMAKLQSLIDKLDKRKSE